MCTGKTFRKPPSGAVGVEAHEQHTHRAVDNPRLCQHVPQRHAGPFRVADGAGPPRWAPRGPTLQEIEHRPVVAGTLEVTHEAAAGYAADVLVGDIQRSLDSVALHAQAPRRGIDIGRPTPVVQHIEEPIRRDQVPLEFKPSLQSATGMTDERLLVLEELRRIRRRSQSKPKARNPAAPTTPNRDLGVESDEGVGGHWWFAPWPVGSVPRYACCFRSSLVSLLPIQC